MYKKKKIKYTYILMSTTSELIIEFSKSTHNICISLGVAVIFIILFMLNSFLITNIFSKCIIVILLVFILYYNIYQTNKFSNNFNINILNKNETWNQIKTNIVCSYVFSLFMLFLIISIIRKY